MVAHLNVLYPTGTKFNMDYYIATHMPLVQKTWSSAGLISWKVLELNSDGPYSVQAMLEWESAEHFKKAMESPATEQVLGDVPNFSDKEPVLIVGDIKYSS